MTKEQSKIKHSVLTALFSGLVACILSCISIRLWEINLSAPPGIGGDGTLFLMLSKSIHENGLMGAYFNQYIGTNGSTLIDVPFLDYILIFQVWLTDIIGGNIFTGYYFLYIMTFGLCAISMSVLIDRFHINWAINICASIIYAIAPYHFLRGFGHITLSNYFAIPLGIYLCFSILEEDLKNLKIMRKIILCLLACIVGLSQLYYAFFILILMCIALLVKFFKEMKISIVIHEAIILYTTVACVIAGLLPKLIYGHFFGANTIASVRVPFEAELYGLKIIQLLLPAYYERIPGLHEEANFYNTTAPLVTENTMASLGLIASIGFLLLCGWLLYSFITGKNKTEFSNRMNYTALSVLVLVLYCTIGGFGTIFNYLITPQIRALNRVSIVISALSILALALVVQHLLIKRKILLYPFMLLTLIIGIYDQLLLLGPGWQGKTNQYQDFFEDVEDDLDSGDTVYQLPYMSFPECVPVHNLADYTHFMGYLYTDNIHWSYGSVIGREDISKNVLYDGGMSTNFIENLKENQFQGVYIDTYGYEDGGKEIIRYYNEELGLTPLISDDSRLYFYKLYNN